MKFIADVNIAQLIIRKLRQDGHAVTDVKKENLSVKDTEIIKQAIQANQIILTHDRDFEGLTKYPKYQAGIIAIRLLNQTFNTFMKD